uniref:AlNc14C14G1659 protein n=1 Tax=Albugo laibachii Nc14 TaxID=890382 RepID=F0W3T3_9STRA|nr:AlNc14C14G1659 [Albugo laibachii Nc14]|eukprot:CCA15753.1 AlNc14C14G1659 [Albugo laibachii Nc14]
MGLEVDFSNGERSLYDKISFSERACEFSWLEDIKVDVLGQHLGAVSDACGGADNLVLENIDHYADPSTRMMILSRTDIHRMEFLRKAKELCQFAQSTEIEACTKHIGRGVVNAVDPRKTFKSKQ